MMDFSTLTTFRKGLYDCFQSAADALMNINDALLSHVSASSFIELSLSPFFERRWPSLYEAFQDGRINRSVFRRLTASHVEKPSKGHRLVLGVDTSSIARPESDTARDRTYQHVPNLPKSKSPVTIGWSCSTLVVLPQEHSSWTYVLDNLRVQSEQTPAQVAAEQLGFIVPLLPERPVVLGDRHYGSAAFIGQTKDIACDKLIRIQGHRVFFRAAPPKTGKRGAPRKDGDRFKLNDPATHGPPDIKWSGVDEKGHRIDVDCWSVLHLKQCRDADLYIIRVTRHAAKGTKRDPRISWFVWQGEDPDLPDIVPTYGKRYSQEHGYRFDKQNLLWEDPGFRTPEQFQVWTDLLSAVRDQLYLARPLVTVELMPWESKDRPITPQQVRRGMALIIHRLGTPARPSQPRGKSPGWPKGRERKRAERYSVVKKVAQTSKTVPKKAA